MLLQPGAVPGPRRERTARAAAGAARDPPSPRPLASLSPLVGDLEHGTHRIPPGTDPRLRSSWLFFFLQKKNHQEGGQRAGSGTGARRRLRRALRLRAAHLLRRIKAFRPRMLKAQITLPKDADDPFRAPAARAGTCERRGERGGDPRCRHAGSWVDVENVAVPASAFLLGVIFQRFVGFFFLKGIVLLPVGRITPRGTSAWTARSRRLEEQS